MTNHFPVTTLFFVTALVTAPLQARQSTELGTVEFSNSCAPASQQALNEAMAILHSFSHVDAIQRFSQLTESDATCAIAYWGLAMSHAQIAWQRPPALALALGRAAIAHAMTLEDVTSRERSFLQAASEIFEESGDWRQRHEDQMARMHETYPEDVEVTLFYVLALIASIDTGDRTYAKQEEAGALAERVFAEQPNHPGAAHYIIHSYDFPPLASQALAAANHYADIAPTISHALHMPTHIFSSLGMWRESIAHNIRSRRAAQRVDDAMMESHALTYSVYAHLQRGADTEAQEQLALLRALAETRPAPAVTAHLASAEAVYTLERRAWQEAADIDLSPAIRQTPRAVAFSASARALGAARARDITQAREGIEYLEQVIDDPTAWRPDRLTIWEAVASAWLSVSEGDEARAIDHMARAVELEKHSMYIGSVTPIPDVLVRVEEQRGDLMMELELYDEALAAFELSLAASPRRFNTLYAAGRAAELAGRAQLARRYFTRLLDLTAGAESARPELAYARNVLAGNELR